MARIRLLGLLVPALVGLTGCPNPLDLFPFPVPDNMPPAHCSDGKRDGDETDLDCGGACGATCQPGQACRTSDDCDNADCQGGVCTVRGGTCFDHARDGQETDIDCGGVCPRCADGKACAVASDCAGGSCVGGVCSGGKAPFAFAAPRFVDVKAMGPVAIVAADFDRDGRLDAAVAASQGSQVAVVRGRGDGTFFAPSVYPVAGRPDAIVATRLVGGVVPDLVVTEGEAGAVQVLANAGDGHFDVLPGLGVGKSPRQTASADLDGDGLQDLVVDSGGAGVLDVLLNHGHGALGDPSSTPLAATGYSIALGDFDRDGHVDVAVAGGSSAVLYGTGAGFGPAMTVDLGAMPWILSALDLGGGRTSLVTSSYQGTVSVTPWLVGAGFGAAVSYQTGGYPGRPALGDFDGDGVADLAVANQGPNVIQILRGLPGGAFETARNFYVGGSLQDMAVGDFDGDGLPDVALCDYWTHDVGVMLNRSGK